MRRLVAASVALAAAAGGAIDPEGYEVRARRLTAALVEVVLEVSDDVPPFRWGGGPAPPAGAASSATTFGRWDAAAWGAGGLPSGGFDEGGDGARSWRVFDHDADGGARLRDAVASTFGERAAALARGAVYASLVTRLAPGADAPGRRIHALTAVARSAAAAEFWSPAADLAGAAAPAPLTVTLTAAPRDRSRGRLVYRIDAADAAVDARLRVEIPSALDVVAIESTLATDAGVVPLLAAGFTLRAAAPASGFRAGAHRLAGRTDLAANASAVVSVAYRTRYPAFDEWAPDQYRGIDVPPAFVVYEGGRAFSDYARVQLPEIDLSMPFNVATLQSTLLAFFVGTVAASLVRRSAKLPAKGDPPKA